MLEDYKVCRVPRVRGVNEQKGFCLYDCIVTYANYINRNYEMMFLHLLEIGYSRAQEVSTCISQEIKMGIIEVNINAPIEDVAKYHGIFVNKYEDSLDAVRKLVAKGINPQKPVVLVLDNYWCYWDKSYQKFHSGVEGHAVFIKDIDPLTNDWIFIDPYDNREEVVVTNEAVEHGYMYYYIFTHDEEEKKELFLRDFKEEAKELAAGPYIRNLEKTGIEMHDGFRYDEAIDKDVDSVYQMDLYVKIGYLKDCYEAYAVLIDFIMKLTKDNQEQCDEIKSLLIGIGKTLNVALVLLGKSFVDKEDEIVRNRISEKFQIVSEKTSTLFSELKSLCSHLDIT